MRTSSIKAKGRRLQNFVAGVFLEIGQRLYGLTEGDCEPRQMGGAGVDVIFSPNALTKFPFDIECKMVEKLNIVAVFNKHARNYETTGRTPLLIHARNNTRVLVTMAFEDFLSFIDITRAGDGHQIVYHPLLYKQLEAKRDSWTAIKQFLFPKPEGQVS